MRLTLKSVHRTTPRMDEHVCAVPRGTTVPVMVVHNGTKTSLRNGCGGTGVCLGHWRLLVNNEV